MSASSEPDRTTQPDPEVERLPQDDTALVGQNFIRDVMERDLREGLHDKIVTRFPPEPNGYAHIGHAFASFLDFGLAQDFGGRCHLRFDDTNPEAEEMRYVVAIEEDMRWLGWTWDKTFFASDYFERLYQLALKLIERGDAYVDSLSAEEIQRYRGTVERPGQESPYRLRSVAENADLFRRMRAGEFPNGAHVLRAKIDMSSANMKLRDPLLYRINHHAHYRTGTDWPIYPFYDFQHPLSDAIEGVTHSLCSLEFVDNRALYDWLVDRLMPSPQRPHQYEFGRRSLEYTVVSKRKLMLLVEGGHVDGWDDPRMPTLAGMRRRGIRPQAIRAFASRIGVSRTNRTVDIAQLEYAVRDDLNDVAKRVMAVLEPLPVHLTNVTGTSMLDAAYWPPDVARSGSRPLPFGPDLLVERSDFAEHPPEGFKRLAPGRAVRLRHAHVIVCDEVLKDEQGNVTELRCHVVPDSLGRNPEDLQVAGAIHWLEATAALSMEARLYDRLFDVPDPDAGDGHFLEHVNQASRLLRSGMIEPSVANDDPETRYQFERLGYFWRDPIDGRSERLVFDQIIALKDTWGRREMEAANHPSEPVEAADATLPAHGPSAEPAPEPVYDLAADLDDAQTARFEALRERFGLDAEEAARLVRSEDLAPFFEEAAADLGDAKAIVPWVLNDLARLVKERPLATLALTPAHVAELQRMVDDGTVTLRVARTLFESLADEGGHPRTLVRRLGLERLDDDAALRSLIDQVIEDHPDERAAYQAGKDALLGFFVGQVMRAAAGRADPPELRKLLKAALKRD